MRAATDAGALVDEVLAALPPGVEADLRVTRSRWGTMRFANSRIHQPHLERSTEISLRVRWDGRLATATTSDAGAEGVNRTVREALSLARVAPREPKFPGFPTASPGRGRPAPFSRSTAELAPEAQVALAESALAGAQSAAPDARVSGAVNVGGMTLVVGNTSGLRVTSRRSVLEASVLVERPDLAAPVSGWAEGADWRVGRLDPRRLGREAAARMAPDPPEAARPGAYRVLLAGSAVAELLSSIGYLGFGGHAELEGWSCLRAERGKRRFPKTLRLFDDGRSAGGLPIGFDYEGLPKRRTALIDEGVVGDPVVDLVTAGRLDRTPTGHALPPESPYGEWGPVPSNLMLLPGTAGEKDLLQGTRRGLWVTRFHYVRVVHPGKGIITGMTRDGTYRIERGEVVAPVRNLRFTQSVPEALRAVELVGRETRRYSDARGFSSVTTPPVVCGEFRFTSATVF